DYYCCSYAGNYYMF
nr:immunoglobulin light chain junction region [Macaca mulatta]